MIVFYFTYNKYFKKIIVDCSNVLWGVLKLLPLRVAIKS
ncbi:hypothetical protein BN3087_510011 [Sulfurovum sp. enrichment culture clone C5]|uniref:Uncharacterized protein n=1 Tax=Sulfurovum sp. enrichment culture clone C5 TaxID=497650 RepID=A0A0S4XNN9_9BACT|nr:hypothetical protein BN3087_510011 [Sulfurovum sp. enrichment culture clone C5]